MHLCHVCVIAEPLSVLIKYKTIVIPKTVNILKIVHATFRLQSWTKLLELYIYLAKYDPHFQQGLTAPSFTPFNVALSEIESQVVTPNIVLGGGGLWIIKSNF